MEYCTKRVEILKQTMMTLKSQKKTSLGRTYAQTFTNAEILIFLGIFLLQKLRKKKANLDLKLSGAV